MIEPQCQVSPHRLFGDRLPLTGRRRLGLLAICGLGSLAATAAPAIAQRAEPVSHTARNFYETTSYLLARPGGHAFSADSRYLLISSDQSGVFNAYLLSLADGSTIPLTDSKTHAIFAASFFPRDRRVLFTSDEAGNELDHVYVRETDGTSKDLTPGKKLRANFHGWSRDGKSFWISTNERDEQSFDVYAYDVRTYARRLVFKNHRLAIGAIDPNGRHVALIDKRSSADNDLYLAGLEKSEPFKLITPHEGKIAHSIFGFGPGGRSVLYGTDEHGEFAQAWSYDIKSGSRQKLIAAKWDVSFTGVSLSGRFRVSSLNADALTETTISGTGGTIKLNGVPEGSVDNIRFSGHEETIAFTVSSDTAPADIFVADLDSGQARRLTRALNPRIAESDLVQAEVVRFKSHDGLEIPGLLYKPRVASGANPVPALVWVHGGPGSQSRRGYNPLFQHLVNNGYAIFAVNNRGSVGYGKTFFHLDDRRHGDVDLKDVIASKSFLQSFDWVAKDRIGVMGISYGGYLTVAALAFYPQVYDVGIDIFGPTNWVRTLSSIPLWWASFRSELFDEMGDPSKDAERQRSISPLFRASHIVKPLLVVQGANDPRVAEVESREIVAAVRANGVAVDYLLFPDEGHGFLKKENRIAASEAYLRFLREHLPPHQAARR